MKEGVNHNEKEEEDEGAIKTKKRRINEPIKDVKCTLQVECY
jgi:hypothetical protein